MVFSKTKITEFIIKTAIVCLAFLLCIFLLNVFSGFLSDEYPNLTEQEKEALDYWERWKKCV